MAPDGYIPPSADKSIVIKLLDDLVVDDIYQVCHTSVQSTELERGSDTCSVV